MSRFLPWLLVIILAAIIGLIVFVFVDTYTGPVKKDTLPYFFFGNRVEALNSDLDKHGVRSIFIEKTSLPLQSYKIFTPLAHERRNITWEWVYRIAADNTGLENEANQFAEKLEDYCESLQNEMNAQAGNTTTIPSQLKRITDENTSSIFFACNLEDTSQIGFTMFIKEIETDSGELKDNMFFEISFESYVRED